MQASYEKHHHCVYTEEAVEAAVTLSSRYIADRQLPDKAIDLLDEAGSRARIAAHMARRDALSGGRAVADAVAPWLELQQVLEAKDEAIKVPSLTSLLLWALDFHSWMAVSWQACALGCLHQLGAKWNI